MEPQQPQPSRPSQYPPPPRLQNIFPPNNPSQGSPRTASSTPVSSPGLFSPTNPRTNMSFPTQPSSEGSTPPVSTSSPFLHPLQTHRVKETHTANVDRDFTTGRKIINHYEVIDEIGRGVHGKVKLARNLENGENVAIKIIPRFSKKRRLGRVTAAMEPQDKTKKEIAILKKIRHPNVVALLEVIDDPELKKIYMVLEHVELGEIVWRKKGLPHICAYERRRTEREMRGEQLTAEEEDYGRILKRRQAIKELKRAKAKALASQADYWSLEYGATDDEDTDAHSRLSRLEALEAAERLSASLSTSHEGSVALSRALTRSDSLGSASLAAAIAASLDHDVTDDDDGGDDDDDDDGGGDDDMEPPRPLLLDAPGSSDLYGTMYGAYSEDPALRGRSSSMADSIISHMSSIDFNPQTHDLFADDFSYVPCLTIDQARSSFRDTLLGLEYLHYEGVVHRDIKPANLLRTKDHRVKMSDFGVSYFGRPIRDGEPDDAISESEAHDFDDDLELAKTVGTPAFFAPELCYTDLEGEQPKVSEQIDVWSLGVTLYCLIFARIPFMAEDEWTMFRKIAKEEVYIPSCRLKPVDPSTPPNAPSPCGRVVNSEPFRDDDDLTYEPIHPNLADLLRRMLTKNPEKRIRLRDVKRHAWVLEGIPDIIAWIDDTDPSRRTAGRRIQVDRGEMDRAVIPLTFLERARSAVKKAVTKVIHSRPDHHLAESASRRRATSSAASSAGESPSYSAYLQQYPRDGDARRKSLRGDDYYLATTTTTTTVAAQPPTTEHPLSHSVTASPHDSPSEGPAPAATAATWTTSSATSSGRQTPPPPPPPLDSAPREDVLDRQTPYLLAQKLFPRRGRTGLGLQEPQGVPTTPIVDYRAGDDPMSVLGLKGREMRSCDDDPSRAQSVDRGLVFASADKRAEAKVSLSTAIAPGSVEQPPKNKKKHPPPRQARSIDLGGKNEQGYPLSSSSSSNITPSWTGTSAYQHGQPRSDPNIHKRHRGMMVEMEKRPTTTAHRIGRIADVPAEGKTPPPPRLYYDDNRSTPESFARAQEAMMCIRRQRQGYYEEQVRRQQQEETSQAHQEVGPAAVPWPTTSPDDELSSTHKSLPVSRDGTIVTAVSSNSASAMVTPLTSPSEATTPAPGPGPGPGSQPQPHAAASGKDTVEQILAFQSGSSLPALLSGASSVSADLEGEFLGNPGVVDRAAAALMETTDSLTPPAMEKEPIPGFPLEAHEESVVPVRFDDTAAAVRASPAADEDDEDSDSDGGLVMAKSKKKHPTPANKDSCSPAPIPAGGRAVHATRRRDTNTSIGSTETAKKVVIRSD